MARPAFDPIELTPTGETYPALPGFPLPGEPKLHTPISVTENWKLLLSGKKPYWIPVWGLVSGDCIQFRPRINPDNVANHQVFDGGPAYPYGDNTFHSSWFELDWEFVPVAGGATVRPGEPKVPDINHWEDYVSMPSLDGIDWEALAEENKEYLGSDRLNQLGIQCAHWERLMALMDVAEACIAICDEEQQLGIHRFFDKYTDFLIEYIGKVADVCDIDCVVVHDDWAHQRGPFMSPDTIREMILPYTKRLVDYCHSRGIIYEIHCCGNAEMLIPLFIESGADLWGGGQVNANDFDAYVEKYKGSGFVFTVPCPDLSFDASDEEVEAAAKAWVEKYKDYHVSVSTTLERIQAGRLPHPNLIPCIYKYSRMAYQNED